MSSSLTRRIKTRRTNQKFHFNRKGKMQSKKYSALEAVTNVIVGYMVAVVSQMVLYPFFNIETTTSQNMVLAGWFTIISLVRSYILRRVFNKIDL